MSATTINQLLSTALLLARSGYRVFPCKPGGKVPLIPKAQGGRGVLDATRDLGLIAEWWRVTPDANVGVACGEMAPDEHGQLWSLLVLDFDFDYDKNPEVGQWFDDHNRLLPDTYEVVTGSYGLHLYYRSPVALGNTVGSNGGLAPGVDTRGQGGYVLAEHSIHPNGRDYWRNAGSPMELAEIPQWLLERLQGLKRRSSQRSAPQQPLAPVPSGSGAPVAVVLAKYIAMARDGNRNRVGFDLARQLRANGHDGSAGVSAMLEYQRAVTGLGSHPYSEEEALKTWLSAQHTAPLAPWTHWPGKRT